MKKKISLLDTNKTYVHYLYMLYQKNVPSLVSMTEEGTFFLVHPVVLDLSKVTKTDFIGQNCYV